MISQNPYKKYQSTQVNTSDSRALLIMLLEGANRFLREGRKAMEEGNYSKSNTLCIKVEKIIMELINTLDLSQGDFTKNLLSLYEYMYRRLVEANIEKDVNRIKEVQVLFADMEDMWKDVYKKVLSEEKAGGAKEKKLDQDKAYDVDNSKRDKYTSRQL